MAMLGANCSGCCTCENRNCTTFGGVTQGNCEESATCCCEVDPEGSCFDDSVLDENGELTVPINEAPLRGYCMPCCATGVIFSMLALNIPGADPNDRVRAVVAAEWVEGVKRWMEEHGYTNIYSVNAYCSKGGTAEEENDNVVWVRGCCDGTYSENTDDCFNANDVAPADNFGLAPQVNFPGGGNTCVGLGGGYWIPLCIPNPLP